MKKLAFPLIFFFLAAIPRGTSSDVVTMKDGKVLKGKIVKEMRDLVKLRMPRRGRICTTYLNKGHIQSIEKADDTANRSLFKKAGVRNPTRDFQAVYYPGPASSVGGGGKGKAASKPRASRKRGVEARRERFKSGLSSRHGTSTGAASAASSSSRKPASTGTSSSSASGASPSSTGSATTTTGGSTSVFGK